ncbi:MAG: hypothetical protein IT385_04275 [Deltaproteobacteria bacterium]|nr:hypothetical protein [Deltaproteobacteria bacterium]
MKPLTLLAAAFALLVAAASSSARAEDKDYALTVSAQPLTVGAPGAIVVKLDVKGGYKWNADYPAKIEITGAPAPLTLPKATLSQLAGDFKAETPTALVVQIPATAKAALDAPVTVSTKFSVCNDRVCLMKKASAVVQITAR